MASSSYAMIDWTLINQLQIAHGVLASLAWVVFFPAGAIQIRLLPGRYAVKIHLACQILGYALFTAAVGLGIHLALYLDKLGAGLLMESHPIIGLTVFCLAFFQVILGFVHHMYFKKYQRRTVWSHAHIWLGRAVITLAMINGGLGLKLTKPFQANVRIGEIVYGVFAGAIWLVFMAVAVYDEVKKAGAVKAEWTEPSSPADSMESTGEVMSFSAFKAHGPATEEP